MIKVAFSGFWPSFNKKNNFLLDALNYGSVQFKVVGNPLCADLVFHSHFKSVYDKIIFKKFLGSKTNIFFSGEATEFDPSQYTASISSRKYMVGQHYRLPLWKIYIDYDLRKQGLASEYGISTWYLVNAINSSRKNKKYAAAVFSNMNSIRRFMLDGLKKNGGVDVYGRYGLPLKNKMEILPDYWLNLCPENAIVPGYITEKVVHAKACGCIPIWYGDLGYESDFNKDALVNVLDYGMNMEEMMDCVDFKKVRETPLMNVADDYKPDLARFLTKII